MTRFFYLNVLVEWGLTLEDHILPKGGRINVVLFGWIFKVGDLHYIDQGEEPPSHGTGIFSQDTVKADGSWLNGLACVHRLSAQWLKGGVCGAALWDNSW